MSDRSDLSDGSDLSDWSDRSDGLGMLRSSASFSGLVESLGEAAVGEEFLLELAQLSTEEKTRLIDEADECVCGWFGGSRPDIIGVGRV